MKYQHKELAKGRWFGFSLVEQIANLGSEIERTLLWKDKNPEYSKKAFGRALELLDLSITDIKNKPRLKEFTRLREALIDYFLGENNFSSSDALWRNYFSGFYYAFSKKIPYS